MRRILMLLILATTGCATQPATYDVENSRTYNKDFNDFWSRTLEYFTSNGIEIKAIDKNSGFIYGNLGNLPLTRSPFHVPKSNSYMDCGAPGQFFLPISDTGQFNLLAVRNSDNTITVTINASFEELRNSVSGPQVITKCASTGLLETNILDHLN